MPEEKEVQVTKQSKSWKERIIAILLLILTVWLMLVQTVGVGLYLLPYISIHIYEMAGITGITTSTLLTEVPLQVLLVILMMWGLPSLLLCLLFVKLESCLWKWCFPYMRRLFVITLRGCKNSKIEKKV